MQSVDLAPKKLIDETIRLYSNLLDWNPTERQLSKPTFNLIHDLVRRVSLSVSSVLAPYGSD